MMLERTYPRVPRVVASVLRVLAAIAIALSIAPGGVAPHPPADVPQLFESRADGPRVIVPASIDPTGASDASAALVAFLDRVPDGSSVVFPAGATFRLEQSIRVDGRHDLTFDGSGARLEIAGCEIDDSAFVIDGLSSGIVIRDFEIVGDNADGGTTSPFAADCQSQAGVAVYSGRDIEIVGVSIERTHGDCVYVDGGGADYTWSDGVWFHDSECSRNGRMGVAVAAARRVMVDHVRFEEIGMFVFDIEPFSVKGGATQVTFRDNTVFGYGLSPTHTMWFVAAEGVPGSVVEDLTVTRNQVLVGAPRTPNTVTEAGLATTIRVERRRNVIFTDNTTTVPGSGPALYFAHIDGLTVGGNVQPLVRGSLARFADCTAVRFDGEAAS